MRIRPLDQPKPRDSDGGPTRTQWANLIGHTDEILDVTFGADGTLYTVSAERTVISWTTDPDAAVTHLRAQLARGFPS